MDKAIGIIGLGRMGYEMLKKLSEAGYTVFCRDINKVAEDKAKTSGGKIVGSPKEMTEHAQVILLSLPMPSDVREVVLGERGLLTDSGNSFIIVDLSTIDPFTTQQNSKEAKKRGCGYIDAPVLGRPQA